ncbi:uncharacterized protein LOC105696481 isoform X2 [Orussus abietinus]|nr:uncharacterized protein LOC105696481 isoform X2 [Orussus abietinus]XP_012274405.1 uncharacterized protein LOC105696481 isoform X2 [Orussus abietinus]
MRRRAGPIQRWVDSIPTPVESNVSVSTATKDDEYNDNVLLPTFQNSSEELLVDGDRDKNLDTSVSTPIPISPAATSTPGLPSSAPRSILTRDPSLRSDSSRCSSVESLLELRRADPEAILLGLGFGGCPTGTRENGPLSRIPKRFLQPSKLKGIAINDFAKHQQETSESLDSTSLGYRGLTGSPYVAPSEIVQKIMDRLREHESHELDAYTAYNSSTEQFSPPQDGKLSVLSPDNRQYLDRPRSKSPDMRNKRMIIGQRSFAFGCDGDLIEIGSSEREMNKDTDIYRNDSPGTMENSNVGSSCGASEGSLTPGKNRVDKRLIKQLSFDDTAATLENQKEDDTSVSDVASRASNRTWVTSSRTESEDVEGNVPRDRINGHEKSSLARRASLDPRVVVTAAFEKPPREERRFSQDSVHVAWKDFDRSAPNGRRKSLKRQSRISNDEASSCILDDVRPTVAEELENREQLNRDPELPISPGPNINANAGESSRESQILDENKNDTERTDSCPSEEHEDSRRDSHYRPSDKDPCRGPDESEKTKKLENVIPKRKQEKTTTRGILSNVRSVKMEPGF